MLKKLILLFLCVDFAVLSVVYFREFCSFMYPPRSSGQAIVINLGGSPATNTPHRSFTVFEFPAAINPPKALILFGSGDGGWTGWEDKVCHSLQTHGYTVLGIDSADYAKTDYDLATLQADYSRIAQTGLNAYESSPPPVIVGGWSMGAAQAIAVGGGPNRPRGLVGLLLLSPCSRGRYGLRVSDVVDILPTGPNTFGVEEFISGLNGLRIVQWHANDDHVDSTAWLPDLTTPHQEYDFPNAGHNYNWASPAFLGEMVPSIDWILQPPSPR